MDGMGSTWGRWDLHIHSPLSIEQEYGGDTPQVWDKFFAALEALPSDITAIGINDYYFLDGFERVALAKRDQGRLKNIKKVFPIVEFRIDTFGSATPSSLSKINLHVIFDIDENQVEKDLEEIRERFIERIHLGELGKDSYTPLKRENLIKVSPAGTLKSGLAHVIPETKAVFQLTRSDLWKDRVVTFLGFTEWNELDKNSQVKNHKQLLSDHSSAYFTAGNVLSQHEKKQSILQQFGAKPLIHSGDIHDFEKLTTKHDCLTWFRAVPSFRGLQQALKESQRRIVLGTPDDLKTKKTNKHNLVSGITFEVTKPENKWFDNTGTIPINAGLVAIIGNKGTGKSALSDCIALALDTDASKMGFLEKERFLKDPARVRTSVSLKMYDGTLMPRALSDLAKENAKPRVRYLPQSFVEDLCGEIGSTKKLQSLIDEILFQHLPANLQVGAHTLSEVIKKNSSAHDIRLEKLNVELHTTNQDICDIETKLSPGERQKLLAIQVGLQADLSSLRKTQKPKLVNKPSTAEAANYENLRQRAVALAKNLQLEIEKADESLAELSQAKNGVLEIKEHVRTIRQEFATIDKLNSGIPKAYRFDVAKALSISIDDKEIDASLENIEKDTSKSQFSRTIRDKAHRKIQTVLEKAAGSLTQIGREYSEFRAARAEWHSQISAIIGAKSKPASKTLRGIKIQLRDISDTYPTKLSSLETKRIEISKNIIDEKYAREKDFAEFYRPAEIYLDSVSKALGLEATELLSIESDFRVDSGFNQKFCSFINKARKGTFYQEKAEHMLTQIRHEALNSTPDGFMKFASRLHFATNHDISDGGNGQATGIDTQLKDVARKLEFYDYVFGFSYANASFTIKFGQRPLDVLSPGERGLLLLAFFFLLDKSSYPLIVDQPEENLDNETIYTKLVTFIRHARTQRQTILVTHNPNLAVACDADQIIVANIDKTNGNQISYVSGALEEDEINEACLRILEGTKPAFKKRGDTYQI